LHPSEALEELMFPTIYSNLLADRFGVWGRTEGIDYENQGKIFTYAIIYCRIF
jgi:hypothetical protein